MNDHSKPRSKERKVVNESGIEIKPLYTQDDVAASGGVDSMRAGRARPRSRAASTR